MIGGSLPPLGCGPDDLETPALCLDLDVMEENIRRIALACSEAGVAWRPHVKGHRSGAIGSKELAAGAIGLTCAKLGEAELMAAAGIRDLLVANVVVGIRKLDRLVALRRHADPIVTVDHIDQLLIVSCSGSGSFQVALSHPVVTEVQAGGAILMDVFYREHCGVTGLDEALTLITTVVGRPAPDRAIVDAGRKALNAEVAMPQVRGRPGVLVERLSAEHGQLRIAAGAAPVEVGDRLEIVPGYADLTVVLHDCFHGFRRGRLTEIIPIAGSRAST